MIGTNYINCFDILMEQEKNWFYLLVTFTSSSGTRNQIFLCIQTLRAIPVAVLPTEREFPWLSPGKKNWILTEVQNPNWSELMICPLWFCGPKYLWRHKDMTLGRILFTKTTNSQFYWKLMVSAVRVTEPEKSTFVIYFWQNKFSKGTWPWNIAPLLKQLLILWVSRSKESCSRNVVKW